MAESSPPRIILVAGPTAVGKSSFALQLAEELGGELVSIDSVQIYRHLDIGSAKPSPEERVRVPHHLIDVIDPDEECNVADFVELAKRAIADIHRRGRVAIAVGGTNLYVRVLVHGIFEAPQPDEAIRARHRAIAEEKGTEFLHAQLREVDATLAERVHPNDLVRISRGLEVYELTGKPLSVHQDEHRFKTPNYEALKIALHRPREALYERINQRVDLMMDEGLLDEYRRIVDMGYDPKLKPLQSLGYRHMYEHVFDDVALEEAVHAMKRDTRRFAKQQISWLRSERDVHWTLATRPFDSTIHADLKRFLSGEQPELDWTIPKP